MRISVITVCYNASTTIEETLDSIKAQDFPDVEHIVVDGLSTDETPEVLNKRSEQIAKIISERDDGIYDAMNKGIAHASGEIVGFLNADDVYADSRVLSLIADAFETHKSDSIYGDLQYVSADNPGKVVRNWKELSYKRSRFKQGWMPPHPTFYVKKELLDKFGAFNTAFKISADYELMLRLLYKYKASTVHIPHILVKMKVGGKSNQSIKNRIIANKEDRKAWKINGLRMLPYTTVFKPLRKINQFWT